jgi:hypothetical protein
MSFLDVDRFYDLLDKLTKRIGGPRRLSECSGYMSWPKKGVYFFFEEGETRVNGRPRVVRVGTHALTQGSTSTLWQRLSQHKGYTTGRRAGGGNHRGSVFRKHVGEALLVRDGDPEGVARTWGIGSSAPSTVRAAEYKHERLVSLVIGSMPFLWLEVPDPPGPNSARTVIEAGAIARLSRRSNSSADEVSSEWLGRHSKREAIKTSCLWNVWHVDDRPKTESLGSLERISLTCRSLYTLVQMIAQPLVGFLRWSRRSCLSFTRSSSCVETQTMTIASAQ